MLWVVTFFNIESDACIMTNKPIAFRPTNRALRIIKQYMEFNQIRGKGALTRAMNEIVESSEKPHNPPDYAI